MSPFRPVALLAALGSLGMCVASVSVLRYLLSAEVEALVCGRLDEGAVLTHCRNAAAAVR